LRAFPYLQPGDAGGRHSAQLSANLSHQQIPQYCNPFQNSYSNH